MTRWSHGDSVFRSLLHQDVNDTIAARSSLKASTKDSEDFVQRLGLLHRLPLHNGCVNSLQWNSTGSYLISGSDDQTIVVSNPHISRTLLKYKTTHRANIFSARFLPQTNDEEVVSCSGDGIIMHTQFLAPYMRCRKAGSAVDGFMPIYERTESDANVGTFSCHKSGTAYEVLTVRSQPRTFMTCGDDCTVRLFDLRQASSCHKTCCKENILVFSPTPVNSMDLSPITQNYLAIGSSDAFVRVYDRRYLSVIDFSNASVPLKEHLTRPVKAYPIPMSTKRQYRVTCVKFSPEESELLVSYSSEYLYLYDLSKEGKGVDQLRFPVSNSGPDALPPQMTVEQVTRRLRLRGDWSDTGPDARPEPSGRISGAGRQVRPQLHHNVMNRMTEVISRMLNDPRTRHGLTRQAAERPTRQDPPSASAAWRDAIHRTLSSRRSQDPPLQPGALATLSSPRAASENGAQSRSGGRQRRQNTSPISLIAAEALEEGAEEKAETEGDSDDGEIDYLLMKFVGHRNARTMIKEANFWGSKYVMSGSDCGHIFIWRRSGRLVKLLQADQHVVNCLQPHPTLPYLASSGIDYDVKMWAPVLAAPEFDVVAATDLMKRNAIMLEQTKDTITVPAAFMIRMLACIHSLQNREPAASTRRAEENAISLLNDSSDNSSTTSTSSTNSSNPAPDDDIPDGLIDDATNDEIHNASLEDTTTEDGES